ncbi:MAG: putative selenate reductase subunit YgfK, partial [Acidobacteria bacterium]
MSDHFSRIALVRLLQWILKEIQTKSVFGIHKDLFFDPFLVNKIGMTRYGQHLESPIGVAAGPHTQMAQNIVTAWLTGSRYIELKTIQTLDELTISKPCIDMEDEGYNCEWSQELKCEDSFDEYLNAWIVIHILRHMFGWHNEKGSGFIFNMSIGYDLQGIRKPNVQQFLKHMRDASAFIEAKRREIAPIYPAIDEV